MSEYVAGQGIKGAVIRYLQHMTNRIKPAAFSLPVIKCKIMEVEPEIRLSDGDCYIECELTDSQKPDVKKLQGRWIKLYEYEFKHKQSNNYILVLDYFAIIPSVKEESKEKVIVDCMQDSLIQQYVGMHRQLEDKRRITQFLADLPSFKSARTGSKDKRPVCQVTGDFAIPDPSPVHRQSNEFESIDPDISRGLAYLVSEFSPSTSRIEIPVTQHEFASLPAVRDNGAAEEVAELSQPFVEAKSQALKLINADIGIGTHNNEITEKVIQERENRKNAMQKQNNDLLDMLDEGNEADSTLKVQEQKDFERYLSWRQTHKELENTNRKLDFKEKGVLLDQCIAITIEKVETPLINKRVNL